MFDNKDDFNLITMDFGFCTEEELLKITEELERVFTIFEKDFKENPKKWITWHTFLLGALNNEKDFQLEVLKFLFEVTKYDWEQISNDSVKPNSGANNNSNDT